MSPLWATIEYKGNEEFLKKIYKILINTDEFHHGYKTTFILEDATEEIEKAHYLSFQ